MRVFINNFRVRVCRLGCKRGREDGGGRLPRHFRNRYRPTDTRPTSTFDTFLQPAIAINFNSLIHPSNNSFLHIHTIPSSSRLILPLLKIHSRSPSSLSLDLRALNTFLSLFSFICTIKTSPPLFTPLFVSQFFGSLSLSASFLLLFLFHHITSFLPSPLLSFCSPLLFSFSSSIKLLQRSFTSFLLRAERG